MDAGLAKKAPTENTPLLSASLHRMSSQANGLNGTVSIVSEVRGRRISRRGSSAAESVKQAHSNPCTTDRPSPSSPNDQPHTNPPWPTPASHNTQANEPEIHQNSSPKLALAGFAPSSHQSLGLRSTPSFSLGLLKGISLRLENSGSVARDHLAVERTFLAYLRTSLAIVGSGVALVQLFSAAAASAPQGSAHRVQVFIRPLGASAIILGLIVLFIGVIRYFTVQTALVKGQFPVARLATGLISVMLTALVSVTFAILLAGKLEPKRY